MRAGGTWFFRLSQAASDAESYWHWTRLSTQGHFSGLYVQTRMKIKKVRQFKCEQSKTPKPVHSLKVVHFDYLQGKDVDLIQKHFCFASCILSIQTVSLLEAPKSNMTTK